MDEIRQQTHVLSEYALTLRTVTEIERINLQTELNNLKNDLQERMSNVETVCKINKEITNLSINQLNLNSTHEYFGATVYKGFFSREV